MELSESCKNRNKAISEMKVRLSTELVIISLVTRLPIPSFLESHITEEIEVRKEIPKPSSLACIHG